MITALKTSRNEVAVIHLLGKQELEFNYKGQVIFEDLESGEKVKVNARDARAHYVQAMESSMTIIKEKLLSSGVGYNLFTLDKHLGEALQLFLKKRANLI